MNKNDKSKQRTLLEAWNKHDQAAACKENNIPDIISLSDDEDDALLNEALQESLR